MKLKRGSAGKKAPAKVAEWREIARADLFGIVDYIAGDNPDAALRLLNEIEGKVANLPSRPRLYRPGRVEGTREMVVRPNYIVVYQEAEIGVTVLRVLHSAQQWPPTHAK